MKKIEEMNMDELRHHARKLQDRCDVLMDKLEIARENEDEAQAKADHERELRLVLQDRLSRLQYPDTTGR